MEVIGKNIRFLRKMTDLTQTDLAKKVGLSRGQISAYEEFRTEPKIQTMVRIAAFFKVSVDTLVKNDLEKSWLPGDIENLMKGNVRQ